MIPKDNEDFAWWVIEKLIDEHLLEYRLYNYDGLPMYLTGEWDIRNAIRRILMENEKEEE